MSTYSAFQTDKEMEKKGIEIDFGDAGCFLIARAGGSNKNFIKVSEAKFRPYRRQVEAGTIDREVMNKLLIEVFAQTVVLNWQGVSNEDGEEMDCTYDNIVKLFNDVPDLFQEIQNESMKYQNFKKMEVEQDLKNSEMS